MPLAKLRTVLTQGLRVLQAGGRSRDRHTLEPISETAGSPLRQPQRTHLMDPPLAFSAVTQVAPSRLCPCWRELDQHGSKDIETDVVGLVGKLAVGPVGYRFGKRRKRIPGQLPDGAQRRRSWAGAARAPCPRAATIAAPISVERQSTRTCHVPLRPLDAFKVPDLLVGRPLWELESRARGCLALDAINAGNWSIGHIQARPAFSGGPHA